MVPGASWDFDGSQDDGRGKRKEINWDGYRIMIHMMFCSKLVDSKQKQKRKIIVNEWIGKEGTKKECGKRKQQ